MFESVNPHDKSTALLEILIMLLVAFIIGFIIAWLLRKPKHTQVDTSTADADNKELKKKNKVLIAEKKQLDEEIVIIKSNLEDCRNSKVVIGEGDGKVGALEGNQTPSFVVRDIGIKPPKKHSVDDLKLIHGIGPFIEKKLNKVGIYSFEQISKFDKKDIETVTDAIEFFPGRIERDNWVGQAADFKDRV